MYGEPDIAHFYLPLPDPIKVEDLTQFPVGYVWNPIEDDGPCLRLPSNERVQYAARQILIFHQHELPADLAPLDAALRIMEVEAARFGMRKTAKLENEPLRKLPVAHTTVEVVAVLDPNVTEQIPHALEEAIEAIINFQTYYHLATKTLLRRLTRKLLPPFVPLLYRPFDRPNQWEEQVIQVNDGGPNLAAASSPTLSKEGLETALAQSHTDKAEIFKAFLLMRQEARLAYGVGHNSAASLFTAIAAETLLTELLLLLLWEEECDLAEAASVIGERDNISKRLLAELANRLKGDWDRNGGGPLGFWQREVADLRNDVAHQGRIPNELELEHAMEAVWKLEKYVGDRLAATYKQYPLSALLFLGTEGFLRRNNLKQWEEYAADIPIPSHTSVLFAGWKNEVQRSRVGPHQGRLDRSVAIGVFFPNGAEHWYLVDEERDLSCPIPTPNVDSEMRRKFELQTAKSEFDVLSIKLPSIRPPAPKDPIWYPSYKVLPLRSISRWEKCLWRPPENRP